jgi:AraC-like DNA-binding protein
MSLAQMRAPSREDHEIEVLQPELKTSLAQLLEFARREIDGNREGAKAFIERASSLLKVEIDRSSTSRSDDAKPGKLAAWQVHRLKAYIDNHLDQTVHIQDLAEVVHRCPAYFCRAFKRTFGETPHAYIVGRRLDRARMLMLTTDTALSEIALICGFADQAHLCKIFRRTDNQSPAVWRRERRGAPIESQVEARRAAAN